MLKFVLPLAILPVLGLSLSQPATAQQPYWWQAGNPDAPGAYYNDQQGYDTDGPYGPDPYASRTDRFNEDQYRAYRREMWRRYHRNNYGYGNDNAYPPPQDYGYGNDPQAVPYAAPVYPVQPQSKVMAQSKPVLKKKLPAAAKPATDTASTAPAATGSTSVVTSSAAAATTTTASTSTTAASAKGPVSCDKGASIVSSFGFEKVASKSCAGTSLVYSAERGGKPFEIEVNPKSGELTAVKKL